MDQEQSSNLSNLAGWGIEVRYMGAEYGDPGPA